MAAQTKIDYGRDAVYGSLAYDFRHGQPREEYSAAPSAAARPIPKSAPRTRQSAGVRARQSISPLSVIGIAAAAALFAFSIAARAELMVVSAETAALRQELSTLQEQQKRLRIEYESVFRMEEIEDYATRILGMQKPSANQTVPIDTSRYDRLPEAPKAAPDSIVDRISDAIYRFPAYLR